MIQDKERRTCREMKRWVSFVLVPSADLLACSSGLKEGHGRGCIYAVAVTVGLSTDLSLYVYQVA